MTGNYALRRDGAGGRWNGATRHPGEGRRPRSQGHGGARRDPGLRLRRSLSWAPPQAASKGRD